MLRQNLDYLATLLYEAGVRQWAVSPGSRNAPIIAGFLRHGGFDLHSFPDERCAAFAAMGMAQASGYTCGVICTSGTAVLNLYPAICEAYYQRIPLLALTADRPAELIDQWDGQTIHQKNIFEKHILASYELPQNLDAVNAEDELLQTLYAAIETSLTPLQGPVHINVPLRDPIYRDIDKPFYEKKVNRHFLIHTAEQPIPAIPEIPLNKKILLLCGQQQLNEHVHAQLSEIQRSVPLIADITANIPGALPGLEMAFQTGEAAPDLRPDILITTGLSITSKKIKQFLRLNKPQIHFHISPAGFVGDPFESNPVHVPAHPTEFFDHCLSELQTCDKNYHTLWKEFAAKGAQKSHWPAKGSLQEMEFAIIQKIMQHADYGDAIHFGNSMPIRYAGWVGQSRATILCNRGTSGIDGSLSTAVGYALANEETNVICILGDMSFFYDSHALWTNKIPENLKIIILNNHGGNIFNIIDGPGSMPGLLPWIQTPHTLNASHIAAHYGIPYFSFPYENGLDKVDEVLSQKEPCMVEFISAN